MRPYGTIILAGLKGHAPIGSFVSDKIVQKRLRLRGVGGAGRRHVARALELLARDPRDLKLLRTHTFPFVQAEHAIRLAGGEMPKEEPIHVTLTAP